MASDRILRRGLPILLALCILILGAGQVAARGPAINDIQPYDTVFVYEEGLNLAGLRNTTTNNPITALQKYQDNNPKKSLTKSIPVPDDTDFEVQDLLVGGDYGTYHAFSPIDGVTAQVMIQEPEINLDVVLASPHHNERLEGLSVSPNTEIAFKITSPDVGASYTAGGVYPATVDIVVTHPGGAETTAIGGLSLAGLNVSSTRFYTDDPGRPGPIALSSFREPGIYSARAEWSNPAAFKAYASASEPVTFAVGNRVDIETGTPTPTPTPTSTPTPSLTPTPPVATTPPTTLPTTATPTTEVPATTTPAETPLPVWAGVAAISLALILAGRRR
ncbi:MAG: DUF3821 domain-containing protein [Methanomicrobiales archaeon]|nr:DUF3821 domain-containing protein [Methanomicrobiales archaeon]